VTRRWSLLPVGPKRQCLIRQADRLKRLLWLAVRVHAPQLAVAKGVRRANLSLNRSAAALASAGETKNNRETVIVGLEKPNVLDPPVVPRFVHSHEVLTPRLDTSIGCPAGVYRRQYGHEFEVLMADLRQCVEIPAIECLNRPAHKLDGLLGHR
jgi:hypothetical protein